MKRPDLPVYYYHDHFVEMLAFVRATYGSILTDEHEAFVMRFQHLSKDAQCLLIRMVNRRGAVFNRSLFRYVEISDLERAVDDLLACGQARILREEDYSAFAACLPKDVLIAGAKAAGRTDVRVSWPKAKLADYFLTQVPFEVAAEHCGAAKFIALDDVRPLEFLLYLYFGKTEEDLKNFALRDLGIMRTNKATSFRARFTDGDEARACFHYSRLLDRIEVKSLASTKVRSPTSSAVRIARANMPPISVAAPPGRSVSSSRSWERRISPGSFIAPVRRRNAMSGWSVCFTAPADKEDAEDLLRRMIDDPASDGEFVFATDFYARKFGGRRTGSCTELLRAGVTLTVDDIYRGNPEAGVAGVMRRRGYRVFFTENTLWHSLFGLLFWDELFESELLHSSFDWVPHCLKDRSFARRFATQIDDKLDAVRSGNALNLLLRPIAAKWGPPNGIFAWDHVDVDALRLLLSGTSGEGIATIVRSLCQNFRDMRDGFPDLMLEKDGAVSFMEIKAEGDVIRRNQLTRLRQLGNAGIRAEIGRVDYRFDPEQDYVVVDVETTGSWAAGDRITEIGAVKIRNHQVVDEWHSLLNPQRAIPARITQITNITNEMVRDAPIFCGNRGQLHAVHGRRDLRRPQRQFRLWFHQLRI